MKTACRVACWLITGTIVVSMMFVLGTNRLAYCGQAELLPRHVETLAARWPTPAPPPNVVFVHIETDEPDLQIGWADK